MSDTIGTFWIVTKQDEIFAFGDSPKPRNRTFSFALTEENYNSWAYITLMARGVTYDRNRVILNDEFIGYLNPTPNNFWIPQTFIVEVYDRQIYGDGPLNRLVIESNNSAGNSSGNLDDFDIKHIIFHHRTHR